ncbi:MAG: sensor domain-containing diguanylate cyclase [Actinomycetota bacterium]|nr:sensor domain-containing diguanylate cyclase [Actinomycetota bacterium]
MASVLIWGVGRLGWATRQPLWVVATAVVGAAVVSFAADVWQQGCATWQLHARIASKTGVVALCIYITGWGPMLAIGLFYTIGDTLTNFGGTAGLWAIAWAMVAIAVGTTGVAFGVVPSEVHPPAVYGLATLAAAGLVAMGMYMRTATMRKEQVQQALEAQQHRFAALVQHSSDLIVVVDADGIVTYASPSAQVIDVGEQTGIGLVVGRTVAEAVHPDDLDASLDAFAKMLEAEGGSASGQMRVRFTDGRWHWMEYIATNQLITPGIHGVVVNGRDITDRKEHELELLQQATHDPLTGLANRGFLLEHLEMSVKRAQRTCDSFAVLYLDLDRFKEVNDTHGHQAGDRLLLTIVDRLRKCVRPEDFVARIGGDEFCVVLEAIGGTQGNVLTADRAISVSRRLIDMCQLPVDLGDDVQAAVSASIGISIGKPGERPHEILRRADMAMYRAKELGRNRFHLTAELAEDQKEDRTGDRTEDRTGDRVGRSGSLRATGIEPTTPEE